MMNNKVSFTNSNNPTISLSAVIYFPPKFDETRQYQAIVLSHLLQFRIAASRPSVPLVRSILVRYSVMVGKTM